MYKNRYYRESDKYNYYIKIYIKNIFYLNNYILYLIGEIREAENFRVGIILIYLL